MGWRLGEGQMQGLRRTQCIGTLLAVALVVAGVTLPAAAEPLFTEQKKLTTPVGEIVLGHVPTRVELSDDGTTLLVNSTSAPITPYVFVRSGNAWALQQTLTAPVGPDAPLYSSLGALSGDNNTALIWAKAFDGAWVFVRSGSTWSPQQKLAPPDDVPGISAFVESVALSADGNTALLGTPYQKAAHVFVRTGTIWNQQQKLTAPDPVPWKGFWFARHVSLSSDGNTALVPAGHNDGCWSGYFFTRVGVTWTLQQELTALAPHTCAGVVGTTYGTLSGDGNTALIGFPWMSAAWILARSGSTWTLQQQLTGTVGPDPFPVWNFGAALALSYDGSTALVGAPSEDCTAGADCGATYVFVRDGGTWTLQQKLTSVDSGAYDLFGESVTLSGKGDNIVVGADAEDCAAGRLCGRAYVFWAKCAAAGGVDPTCFTEPFLFKNWVVVGCEIVDCCPFCPGPLIDWTIRVDGDPVEALILRFENLHPAVARQLRVEGGAQWLTGDRLRIKGQGETILRGFMPPHSRSLRWSLMSPRMTLDRIVPRDATTRLGGQAGVPVERTGTIRVRVEQKVGNVTINNSSLVYRYR